jgi:myosin heavy subunit
MHAFAHLLAAQAYATMKKLKNNQCIVVSGESGAGKTETNRHLLNYLVWRGTEGQAEDTLTQKILDTNPILESFGNAKTTRNNNSSRFGRYVLVRFNDACEVVGAQVRTFLLERSRVTSTSKALERSYHVFYELVAGKRDAPGPVESYHYLSLSGQTTCPDHNDAEEFGILDSSLLSVGIPRSELDDVWACVAAMLFLGNIKFGTADNANIDALGATDPLRVAEKLLGVEDMSKLLVTRQIIVNGETTVVNHNPDQAFAARDALVKIMYDRMFVYLVNRINATVDDPSKATNYIGLLDVYGFEFFEVNSFEQLCINFANEKLQQFFLSTVFENEAQQYKEEGIPWTPIAYADNKEIIDLCENSTNGIYKLLDSQCRAPNTSGKTFCAQLHQTHSKQSAFGAPKIGKKEKRTADEHFLVRHFAGDVVYLADEFLAKNNDSLAPEVEAHLLKSAKKICVDAFTPEAVAAPTGNKGGAKKGGGSFASVGDKFVKSLKALMTELQAATAHFVRCIKSNPELKPKTLHGESVITQLRMSGTLDAVRLIQAGYPTRIPYDSIHGRYAKMLGDIPGIDINSLSPAEFCEAVSDACGVGKSEYALGVNRMFFKMGAAAFLEELAEADPEEMKPKLIEMFRIFEEKRKAKPMVEKTVAMWLHKRRYVQLVQDKRKKETETLRKAEDLKRKADEERRRKEEAERRRREEEERRKQ